MLKFYKVFDSTAISWSGRRIKPNLYAFGILKIFESQQFGKRSHLPVAVGTHIIAVHESEGFDRVTDLQGFYPGVARRVQFPVRPVGDEKRFFRDRQGPFQGDLIEAGIGFLQPIS